VDGVSSHTNQNYRWVNELKEDPDAGYRKGKGRITAEEDEATDLKESSDSEKWNLGHQAMERKIFPS
jgi:hypothetical protein